MEKIKELFKKRIVILGTILVLPLLGWYMFMPIEIKDCHVGNIQYAHKYFNTCSDKIMFVNTIPDYNTLYNIQNQSDKDKIYTKNNIAGHIATNRYIINNDNKPFKFFELSWVFVLETIGHYDEAINYLKSFNNIDYDHNILSSYIKESCYDNTYAKNRRISILGCKIASPVIMLQVKKEMKNNNDAKVWIKKVQDIKNDVVKMPKYISPLDKNAKLADESIDKKQYDLAEKYINEYRHQEKYSNNYIILLYFKLGMAYMNKQSYSKAIENFEKILEIQNYNYKAHEKLEICYRKQGNNNKANEHARIMKELLAL